MIEVGSFSTAYEREQDEGPHCGAPLSVPGIPQAEIRWVGHTYQASSPFEQMCSRDIFEFEINIVS